MISLSTSAQFGVGVEQTNWCNLIMQRIQQQHKNITDIHQLDSISTYYTSLLNQDGSFSNVDYSSTAQTAWNPLEHLNQMKYLVLAYTIPQSKYFQHDSIYTRIEKMFDYWYNTHPQSTNWYYQQIAVPQNIGVLLILMRSGDRQLPEKLENNLLERMQTEGGSPNQPGSLGTGANKLDIATHWIYRGCLTQNEETLSFGAEQVYYPLFLTTKEGLQHDFSYQQHGPQIHIGAYGFVFVDGISSIAAYMRETPYEMSKEKIEYLGRFIRDAYIPSIRGENMMFNVVGRSVSRKNALNQNKFIDVLNRMKNIDIDNALEYDKAIARIKGNKPVYYALDSLNHHFWRSDYILHQRPGYNFDIRGSSIHTSRSENGNNEHLKGYFLCDGATQLTISGKEFENIFNVWDWTHIPGTTTPAVNSIPLPQQWENPGTSVFSGSVSDGKYGVTTYLYNDTNFSINTSAQKSWFMFDDEIVCLGANIKSDAYDEINTTINQCYLNGEVWISRNNNTEYKKNKGEAKFSDLSWIHHDNVAYLFPKKAEITLYNDTQRGSWKSINTSQPDSIETKDVFKLWLQHGIKPTNDAYEYVILPNKTIEQVKNYSLNTIEVISNNESIQAVSNNKLGILGVVFYKPSTLIYRNIEIKTDKPCVIMFKGILTSNIDIYLSDPSKKEQSITIEAKFPGIPTSERLSFVLPIYPDPFAGATLSKSIIGR